jgi:LysR family transcriptional regulator for metE and metH
VHPELAVELVPDATADPIAALIDGRIDLALATAQPPRSRFVTEPLFDDELVAVLPPGHALANRRFIGSEVLVDEPLFLFELGIRQREYFRKRLFPRGGGFRRVHRVPLTEAIVALVRAGAGCSILPRWSVEEALARGEVAVVRLTRGGLRRHWHAVYSRQSPHRAALTTLLTSLRSVRPDVASGGEGGSRRSAGARRRGKRRPTS